MFEGLDELVLAPTAGRVEVREVLVKACGIATAEYGRLRERKSVLPECVALFEEIGQMLLKA